MIENRVLLLWYTIFNKCSLHPDLKRSKSNYFIKNLNLMKTFISKLSILSIALSLIMLASCGSSGLIQKRKYNKGFHFSHKKKIKAFKAIEKHEFEATSTLAQNENDHNSKVNDIEEQEENISNEKAISDGQTETLEKNKFKSKVKQQKHRGRLVDNLTFFGKSNVTVASPKKSNPNRVISTKGRELDDDARLIIGLIIAILLLPPVGVGIALGFDDGAAKTNLWLFLGGLLLTIAGFALIFVSTGLGMGLYVMGAILLFAAWIHGIVVIVKQL